MSSEFENEETTETVTKKKTKKTREMLEECDRKMQELQKQRADCVTSLDELMSENEKLGERSALNLEVEHHKFGKGEIIHQDGKYVDVQFDTVVKKFVLPAAIAEKFLILEDEEILNYYLRSDEIHNKILKVQLQIRSIDFAVERLNDSIEKLGHRA